MRIHTALPTLGRAQLDPLHSPVLQRELPGLAAALEEQTMRDRLQALLYGAAARYQIERCNPGQAIYLAGDFCGLRYEMEVRDQSNGTLIEPLVIGRVFQDRDAGTAFLRDKLAPVVDRMQGRPEVAPFAQAAAWIEELSMVIHTFPIDGDLPILVDVTDRRVVPELLATMLPEARAGRFIPRDCHVELAHYGRQHRCTLRYTLTDDGAEQRVVYGKVAADGSGARTGPAIAALRERLDPRAVNIPEVLAYGPDLQLLLLEAIPGKPQVARLLKARLAGETASGALTLEDAIGACGPIAAAMHNTGIELGRRRALQDELDWLAQSILALSRVSPELGARLQDWLAQTTAAADRTTPLPLCFSHGDFTYTQLIFDGQQSGLVDFDTICQAEPALDLGQFLAYQRLAILKDQRRSAPMPAEATELLCERFLQNYIAARGPAIGDERELRERAAVYEVLMLLRLAIHSWQKLKVSRLEHTLTLLEERVSCLA
ncbi:MAG TPA: phosphotransferase [Roseiflexaceae bacterium]|nr:phosphotransferase [Roseiflexaceae bacterium]